MQQMVIDSSDEDVTPFDYLVDAAGQEIICEPGNCATYSSANYVLLGFVLQHLQGVERWEDMDQMAVIPPKLRASGRYSNTFFAGRGPCKKYPRVAHQYARDLTAGKEWIFEDLYYKSCLNGWTMGNIVSTAEDLAKFYYDIQELKESPDGFVNATTLGQMMNFRELRAEWCDGCQYGFGFLRGEYEQDGWPVLDNETWSQDDVELLGHSGENWGSGAMTCGYNPKYRFGMCLTHSSLVGMDCAHSKIWNDHAVEHASCLAYDAVLDVVGGPRLACIDGSEFLNGPGSEKCSWRRQVS